MEVITGGVTAPAGFFASGVGAGIKRSGLDVAVIYSDSPASAGAVFTTNRVKAAPVLWSQRILSQGHPLRAIVVNSGNANACTGQTGWDHAVEMSETAAASLGLRTEEVWVASTGVIGVPLPIRQVRSGIESACRQLGRGPDHDRLAAEAILTTDTHIKTLAVRVDLDGGPVVIGGMAKGSGMIHPNMATMLAFIVTDAEVPAPVLQALLRESVEDSYHMISVDGDTSTNDAVMVLANGRSGTPPITPETADYERFRAAFHHVNTELARAIARDGEGATKLLEVRVTGARSTEDARRICRTVASSNLVKTAMFGADANWGRVLAAMGRSGAVFDLTNVTLTFSSRAGEVLVLDAGDPVPFDEASARRILEENEVVIDIRLTDGAGQARGWGCDLSYEYVRINGEYRT
jgi:glutamate N-acetyltransferase/amino-acid N-acetyltransferase